MRRVKIVSVKIYTKTGDTGETSLFGGKRISKADLQVEAYGTVDELSSFLGLAHAKLKDRQWRKEIEDIQKDLWKIMAALSGSKDDLTFLSRRIAFFEKRIDKLTADLPVLRRFILPGGTEVSSLFHICRTVCRRAERRCVALLSGDLKFQTKNFKLIVKYLNRLSDTLFMYARYFAKGREVTTRV